MERLHLEANSFYGQIPEALRPLRGLAELDLSDNNFLGPIPNFLVELSLLKHLNLSFNELEGPVPEGGIFLSASAVSVFGNRKLCGGVPSLNLPICKSPRSKKVSSVKARVISGVLGSSSCLALLILCLSIFYCKKKQTTTTASTFEQKFPRISYEKLFRATDRFSDINLIGEGSYGKVYKGIFNNGDTVAVKVLNLTQRASRSFFSECETLGKIRHRNLVKILSVCLSVDRDGNDFKALIYEFMAKGSLEEWLHPQNTGRDDEHYDSRNLRLKQRLKIAIDVGTAIENLHKGCSLAIIHGDLKPSNVLLDNDMMARVGDFGLAKIISAESTEASGVQQQGNSTSTAIRGSIGYVPLVSGVQHQDNSTSTAIRGSIGYVPPEYGIGHKVSTLGDAYSYGILLLEIFIGKRPTEEAFGPCFNLHSFVRMALPNRAMDIIDWKLLNEAGYGQHEIRFRECIISILEVGIACSMESPPDRMDMTRAIKKLYSIKTCYET